MRGAPLDSYTLSLCVMIWDMSWKSEKRRWWWGQIQQEGMLQWGPSKHSRGCSARSVWSPYQTQQHRASLFNMKLLAQLQGHHEDECFFLIYILSSVIILDAIGLHVNAECLVTKNRELVCWYSLSGHVDSYQLCLCLKGHETKRK